MKNYLTIGPVSIRVSRDHLASWGYPLVQIRGLSLFTRDTGGRLQIASYHPVGITTWRWCVSIYRDAEAKTRRDPVRMGQWHDYYKLPFGWVLVIGQQNYEYLLNR